MSDLVLPPSLQARLDALPNGLQRHIDRVRGLARDLAAVHGIDPDLAELTAAAHDVARHIPGPQLIEDAERLGMAIDPVERAVPVLLHGPVGAAWIEQDAAIAAPDVIEGVRWHTTAHPDLAPVGLVVFIADKLDPHKLRAYPFQPEVREAAMRSLTDGALTFIDGVIGQHLDRRELVHPLSTATRNALLFAAMRC